MEWSDEEGMPLPIIDPEPSTCDGCKACILSCPVSAKQVINYAERAKKEEILFGIGADTKCYVGCEADEERRKKSASGGVVAAFLIHALETNEIDGVVATRVIPSKIGEPHSEAFIARTVDELNESRGSNYGPHQYVDILSQLEKEDGRFAFIGVPCVIRGIRKISGRLRKKIRFTISLPCTVNFNSHLTDYLATRFKIGPDEPFVSNLRDKEGMKRGFDFNFMFKTETREVRRTHHKEHFVGVVGGHLFGFGGCAFCPDFYGVDADLVAKDAWGPPVKEVPDGMHNPPQDDAGGTSFFLTRNDDLDRIIHRMREQGLLIMGEIGQLEMGQVWAAQSKHIEVGDRMWQHPYYKAALEERENKGLGSLPKPSGLNHTVRRYRFTRRARALNKFLYRHCGGLSAHMTLVPLVLFLASPVQIIRSSIKKKLGAISKRVQSERERRAKERARKQKERKKAKKQRKREATARRRKQ